MEILKNHKKYSIDIQDNDQKFNRRNIPSRKMVNFNILIQPYQQLY